MLTSAICLPNRPFCPLLHVGPIGLHVLLRRMSAEYELCVCASTGLVLTLHGYDAG